ncbi:G2/mitotic-specific cyclin-B3 [Balamuthia mandrillaris]
MTTTRKTNRKERQTKKKQVTGSTQKLTEEKEEEEVEKGAEGQEEQEEEDDQEQAIKEAEGSAHYRPRSEYWDWQSPQLTPRMRALLLDWLMEVCLEFRFRRESFAYAVNYIDRFLSLLPCLARERFQLVGIVALFVAAKLVEDEVPPLEQWAKATANTYTVNEIRGMERFLLQTLNWRLLPITPFHCLVFYLQKGQRAKLFDAFTEIDGQRPCSLIVSSESLLTSSLSISASVSPITSSITLSSSSGSCPASSANSYDEVTSCHLFPKKQLQRCMQIIDIALLHPISIGLPPRVVAFSVLLSLFPQPAELLGKLLRFKLDDEQVEDCRRLLKPFLHLSPTPQFHTPLELLPPDFHLQQEHYPKALDFVNELLDQV